jgi:replicative DNA helicase
MPERTLNQRSDDARRGNDSRRGTGGRVPPHNLQAEESVLGALLLSRDAIGMVSEQGLGPADFYRPAHQHIFDAIRSLYSSGGPVDTVTVAEELRRVGCSTRSAVLDAARAAERHPGHLERRPLRQDRAGHGHVAPPHRYVAGEIAEIAYMEPDDVAKAIDDAESKVFEVAEQRVADRSPASSTSCCPLANDQLEKTYERGSAITGVPTGFHDLDELLSGLQPSTLNIVGARPAMGKTAFASALPPTSPSTANQPVLVFSLEMGHAELAQRILSSESRVDSQKMRTGRLTEADWSKVGGRSVASRCPCSSTTTRPSP